MNQLTKLTKLIEQYERENPWKFAKNTAFLFPKWNDEFVLWLASRPTCGVEQRKFLDEVEKLEYDETFGTEVLRKKELTTQPIIFGCEFPRIDLQKVIKGE